MVSARKHNKCTSLWACTEGRGERKGVKHVHMVLHTKCAYEEAHQWGLRSDKELVAVLSQVGVATQLSKLSRDSARF